MIVVNKQLGLRKGLYAMMYDLCLAEGSGFNTKLIGRQKSSIYKFFLLITN